MLHFHNRCIYLRKLGIYYIHKLRSLHYGNENEQIKSFVIKTKSPFAMTRPLVLMSVEIYIIFDLKQFFRKRDFSSPLLSTWLGLPPMFFKITCKVKIFIISISVIVYGQDAGPNDMQSFLRPTRLYIEAFFDLWYEETVECS